MRALALACLVSFVCVKCIGSELENRVLTRAIANEAFITVPELCSVAQRSITVYLDNFNPAPLEKIYNSLLSAFDRNVAVSVFLYISSRPETVEDLNPVIVKLAVSGVEINGVVSSYRLPGAIVVVDERFIVEDGASVGLPPFEGALVVESLQMAELSAERVKMFPRFKLELASDCVQKGISLQVSDVKSGERDSNDDVTLDSAPYAPDRFIDFVEFRDRVDAHVKNGRNFRLHQ
jgi:hypothetical protein